MQTEIARGVSRAIFCARLGEIYDRSINTSLNIQWTVCLG